MDILQLILLGLVQGVTEFLPISSSAHLILLALLYPVDQGLTYDIAAHLGTLLAVVCYLRQDLRRILKAGFTSMIGQPIDQDGRLFWYLGIATLPIAGVGYFAYDFVAETLRDPLIIALSTIVFGILLLFADTVAKQNRRNIHLRLSDILYIGLAQVLALVPGTSRSGVTMTAGLLLGLDRASAARFSFLLSIPIIILAGGHEVYRFWVEDVDIDLLAFAVILSVSWLSALLTMRLFLHFIQITGMLPYVIYRLLLGGVLLYVFV